MMIRKGLSLLSIVLVLILGVSVSGGAQGRRNQQQDNQAAAAQKPVGPQATSKPELDAFNALQADTNASTRITKADSFLTTYPNSELLGYAHRFKMDGLARTGKYKEAIAEGELGLAADIKFSEDLIKKIDAAKGKDKNLPDKNSPEFKAFLDSTQKAMLFYYQSIMTYYQQLNDAAKTIEYAEKALDQDPEDLVSLLTLSGVLSERPPTDEKTKEEQMKRVLDLGKKAEAKVTALVSAAGAQMREEQKSGLVSSVHQTLGLANFHLKKWGDSQKEYLAAIAAKKDDPVSYYRLGLAYIQDKKVDPALDALAKSVFLKGPTEPESRDLLQKLYEAKNKNTTGIDDFVKSAGQKIGQ